MVPAPPQHWEADVLLRDGRTAHIRPIHPDDRDVFVEFYARVSDQSKYYRFFSPMPRLSERDLDRFLHVDHVDRVAFVLTLQQRIIAVGRYDVIRPGEAEVAFLVEDQHQGRGIGRFAIDGMLDEARERGLDHVDVIYESGPEGPEPFFSRVGFTPVGETEFGETVARITL